MEVPLTPDLQAKLNRLASQRGAPAKLLSWKPSNGL